MKLSIITNKNSWFVKFGKELQSNLEQLGHQVSLAYNISDIKNGDICFILSFSKILDEVVLKKNSNNIVVHASDLPTGKGFSPMQWSVLEGNNHIVLTLFEAVKELDAGPYYLKESVMFEGFELYEEMREIIGNKIVEMCLNYVNAKSQLVPKEQKGVESFYKKRVLADDEIDPSKSIIEQFNHFRVADNENFPLYFYHEGKKYYLKIYRDKTYE